MEFNYSYLRGFINDNPNLKTLENYAKFLGITPQALRDKLSNKTRFTQTQIAKTKQEFNLSDKETCDLFFYL